MAKTIEGWERRGEAFWRTHHEAWKRSALNQREYCEAQRIPQKAFENWRQVFSREPQAPGPKLLYRRGGLSHTLSHSLSHMAYCTSPITVPPARDGRRRRFSAIDRRRILEEASQPGASLSEVARRHGLDRRMLIRWKQELASADAVRFVPVEIVDEAAP